MNTHGLGFIGYSCYFLGGVYIVCLAQQEENYYHFQCLVGMRLIQVKVQVTHDLGASLAHFDIPQH